MNFRWAPLVPVVLFSLSYSSLLHLWYDQSKNTAENFNPPQVVTSWRAQQPSEDSSARAKRTEAPTKPPKWVPTDEWLGDCVRIHEKREPVPFDVPWPMYALGDCIKMCYKCDSPYATDDTFMALYRNQACPKSNSNYMRGGNLALVSGIFQLRNESQGFYKPDPEALLLHLRLGDVIEHSNATVATMLTKGADPNHHKSFKSSIKSVYEYLSDIETSGFTKVEIVGGSHKAESQKSRVYAGCLEEAIAKAGYKVSMKLSSDLPDRDFYYMSHASKIVVSAGGFSALIGRLVEFRGGLIVGRIFHKRQSKNQKEAAASTTQASIKRDFKLPFVPILSDSITDPWKRDLFARLDRIRLSCGELCAITDDASYKAKLVKEDPPRIEAKVDCDTIMASEDIDARDSSVPFPPPEELMPFYTLNGMILFNLYKRWKTSNVRKGAHRLVWKEGMIDDMLVQMANVSGAFENEAVGTVMEKLRKIDMKDKSVLVIGTQKPWVEAICLQLGASKVTTLEHDMIVSEHRKLMAITPSELRQGYQNKTLGMFDVVVSWSSVEHAGLGRYGDALNPWGDILTVARAWCVTKPKGKLLLGVPTGKDDVTFNGHRWYGKVRWPLVTANWKSIDWDYNVKSQSGAGFLLEKIGL